MNSANPLATINCTCPHCQVYVSFSHLRQWVYRCPHCHRDIVYKPTTGQISKVIKDKKSKKQILIPMPMEDPHEEPQVPRRSKRYQGWFQGHRKTKGVKPDRRIKKEKKEDG